jgi:hypothetical protein
LRIPSLYLLQIQVQAKGTPCTPLSQKPATRVKQPS